MKRIVYVGFYDMKNDIVRKRNAPPSAVTKMHYIIRAMNQLGYGVDVVSPARPEDQKADKGCFLRDDENTMKLFASTRADNMLCKTVSYIQRQIELLIYLQKNLSADDVVVVYHSVFHAPVITWLKKKIGFRLIAEVEEIYADVTGNTRSLQKENAFFEVADGFIFPTELLNDKININRKPYAIIHGTYQCERDRGVSFNDGRIHVVYAGILDPRKGGTVAASAAEYLDERYSMHILGFGLDEEIETVKTIVEEVSRKTKCAVAFEGLKQGEEYIRFIQSCDIGLCPQDPKAAFTSTSFPSKILSYMANGLRVLSIRIPAIEDSAVGKYLYFFDEQTPQEVAHALKKIDISKDYDSRSIINRLDQRFLLDMRQLLETDMQ